MIFYLYSFIVFKSITQQFTRKENNFYFESYIYLKVDRYEPGYKYYKFFSTQIISTIFFRSSYKITYKVFLLNLFPKNISQKRYVSSYIHTRGHIT